MQGRDEARTEEFKLQRAAGADGNVSPPVRLAVGLGDPQRERALLPALIESGEFAIAERCLAADQLLSCLGQERVDAVVVAADLHRLTRNTLAELARSGVPLVVLAAQADETASRGLPGIVVPLSADAATVQQALAAALRGERRPPAQASDGTERPAAEPAGAALEGPPQTVSLLAVAGGYGSPGRTTVALNLAAALGAVAPTILVDADLCGPSLAACLDADPTRNLSTLAHAEPESASDWDCAIAQETQPLGPFSPHGALLCGLPKVEMRSGISTRFFERLVAELRHRYRYVIFDLGAELVATEAAVHRTALGLASHVLVVAAADLVGLWHARSALAVMKKQLRLEPERLALVINRHERRYHHGRTEIDWALGVQSAAVIPYDHAASQRALMAQRPLVLDRHSRAAGALLGLAERVHRGTITLPPELSTDGRVRWRNRLPALRLSWPWQNGRVRSEQQGAADGRDVAHIR